MIASSEEEKRKTLKQIYDDYLYKDIAIFLSDTEFFGFDRFLRLFASKIGSLIQLSTIAEELHIPTARAKKYISLLESTFLFHLVPPYV